MLLLQFLRLRLRPNITQAFDFVVVVVVVFLSPCKEEACIVVGRAVRVTESDESSRWAGVGWGCEGLLYCDGLASLKLDWGELRRRGRREEAPEPH